MIAEIIPYTKGDLSLALAGAEQPYDGWLDMLEEMGTNYTVIGEDNSILGVVGFIVVFPGVAEAFAVIHPVNCAGYGASIARLMKTVTKEHIKNGDVHRIQGTCDANSVRDRAFMRASGFVYEGTLRKGSSSGEDTMIFGIVGDAK